MLTIENLYPSDFLFKTLFESTTCCPIYMPLFLRVQNSGVLHWFCFSNSWDWLFKWSLEFVQNLLLHMLRVCLKINTMQFLIYHQQPVKTHPALTCCSIVKDAENQSHGCRCPVHLNRLNCCNKQCDVCYKIQPQEFLICWGIPSKEVIVYWGIVYLDVSPRCYGNILMGIQY